MKSVVLRRGLAVLAVVGGLASAMASSAGATPGTHTDTNLDNGYPAVKTVD